MLPSKSYLQEDGHRRLHLLEVTRCGRLEPHAASNVPPGRSHPPLGYNISPPSVWPVVISHIVVTSLSCSSDFIVLHPSGFVSHPLPSQNGRREGEKWMVMGRSAKAEAKGSDARQYGPIFIIVLFHSISPQAPGAAHASRGPSGDCSDAVGKEKWLRWAQSYDVISGREAHRPLLPLTSELNTIRIGHRNLRALADRRPRTRVPSPPILDGREF